MDSIDPTDIIEVNELKKYYKIKKNKKIKNLKKTNKTWDDFYWIINILEQNDEKIYEKKIWLKEWYDISTIDSLDYIEYNTAKLEILKHENSIKIKYWREDIIKLIIFLEEYIEYYTYFFEKDELISIVINKKKIKINKKHEDYLIYVKIFKYTKKNEKNTIYFEYSNKNMYGMNLYIKEKKEQSI